MKTLIVALALIAFGAWWGYSIGRVSTWLKAERCIEQWWQDMDGVAEAPWWNVTEAIDNIESQKTYLRHLCK